MSVPYVVERMMTEHGPMLVGRFLDQKPAPARTVTLALNGPTRVRITGAIEEIEVTA